MTSVHFCFAESREARVRDFLPHHVAMALYQYDLKEPKKNMPSSISSMTITQLDRQYERMVNHLKALDAKPGLFGPTGDVEMQALRRFEARVSPAIYQNPETPVALRAQNDILRKVLALTEFDKKTWRYDMKEARPEDFDNHLGYGFTREILKVHTPAGARAPRETASLDQMWADAGSSVKDFKLTQSNPFYVFRKRNVSFSNTVAQQLFMSEIALDYASNMKTRSQGYDEDYKSHTLAESQEQMKKRHALTMNAYFEIIYGGGYKIQHPVTPEKVVQLKKGWNEFSQRMIAKRIEKGQLEHVLRGIVQMPLPENARKAMQEDPSKASFLLEEFMANAMDYPYKNSDEAKERIAFQSKLLGILHSKGLPSKSELDFPIIVKSKDLKGSEFFRRAVRYSADIAIQWQKLNQTREIALTDNEMIAIYSKYLDFYRDPISDLDRVQSLGVKRFFVEEYLPDHSQMLMARKRSDRNKVTSIQSLQAQPRILGSINEDSHY